MTAYLALVIITAILSIILTFKFLGKPGFNWFLQWCLGFAIGIAILFYVTLPLMEWSITFNILFWAFTILQLALVLKELMFPALTKKVCDTHIVVTYHDSVNEFTSEPHALTLMNHLHDQHIPFKVTGLH